MAAFQERNGSYRVFFNYRGKQRAFTIGRVAEAATEGEEGGRPPPGSAPGRPQNMTF